MPGMREDHAAASAVPCCAGWQGGTQLPRHAAVRDVWVASAHCRQAERFARERVPLSTSTPPDYGPMCAMTDPFLAMIHTLRCSTIHATNVASTQGRVWRCGRAFFKPIPMAAKANYTLQVASLPRCWSLAALPTHVANFCELADVKSAARKKSDGERSGQLYPIALEAVQKLDTLFDSERGINGKS